MKRNALDNMELNANANANANGNRNGSHNQNGVNSANDSQQFNVVIQQGGIDGNGNAATQPNSGESLQCVLNEGTEEEVLIKGYLLSRNSYMLQWVLTVLTIGLLQLVFFWRRDWQLRFTHRPVSLAEADHLLCTANDDRISSVVCKIKWLDPITGTVYRSRPAEDGGSKANGHGSGDGKMNKGATFESFSDLSSTANLGGSSAGNTRANAYQYIRFFVYQKLRYTWDDKTGKFTRLLPEPLAKETPCSYFYDILSAGGVTEDNASYRKHLYGENAIEIEVTPILNLLIKEILGPFYVFQLFAIILWYATLYYYYASCIVLMSALSAGLAVYVTRKSQRTLQQTVHGVNRVNVVRNGKVREIDSNLLVPGDMIEIPTGNWVATCDAVLVSGICIMGEAMLTGESMPVTKTALPNQNDKAYSLNDHGRHLLSGGTLVIQSKKLGSQPVRAIVLRTGWSTRKGDLVRSILFPKAFAFHFNRHSYYFLLCLGGLGVLTFIYTWVVYALLGQDAGLIVNKGLSMITIVVPPALPAAMTIALISAQRRLKNKNIFSISQKFILVCGAINAVCFDKTGTLTEDGLDIWGFLPSTDSNFDEVITDMKDLPQRGPLACCLAACHSLAYIDGQLLGDPLELKMFAATGWSYEEIGENDPRSELCSAIAKPSAKAPGDNNGLLTRPARNSVVVGSVAERGNNSQDDEEIGIVRMFTFESSLQRMSVIGIHPKSKDLVAFAKGSPEMICKLCKPNTIPPNFDQQLNFYARQGYRIIGLGWKQLASDLTVENARSSDVSRDSIECDLDFLGLLIMENRLKEATTPTLMELRNADIRPVMVTGDNILTALTVAKKCTLIDDDDCVVIVDAVPPEFEGGPPTLKYSLAESETTAVDESGLQRTEIHTPPSSQFRFAMTGTTWAIIREHYPTALPELVTRGAVFARMAPEQKAQLVEELQGVGYYVAMCGDGANDCGALKAAHTGCSLSEAEASVASPFTSKVQDISCISHLIKEGRCSLVGSFGVFKFMLLYSFSELVAACYVYWSAQDLGPQQYLWEDLFQATTIVTFFCWAEPSSRLTKIRPPTSLIGFTTLFEMAVHIIILTVFQGIAFLWTYNQPWAFPASIDIDPYMSETNRAVFQMSSFQIIGFAIIVAHSYPYRKSIFTNYWFLLNIALLIIFDVLIFMLINYDPNVLNLVDFPSYLFRFDLILLALANFFVSYIFENFIMETKYMNRCIKNVQTCKCRKKPRYLTKYAKLDHEMSERPHFPKPSAQGNIVQLEMDASDHEL